MKSPPLGGVLDPGYCPRSMSESLSDSNSDGQAGETGSSEVRAETGQDRAGDQTKQKLPSFHVYREDQMVRPSEC